MKAIFRKEMADFFSSIRCFILFCLAILISALAIYAASKGIRTGGSEGFIFLRLFTAEIPDIPLSPLFTFVNSVAFFFIPIIGITLGFDAINSEHSGRTLGRILSQPVFRDSVINSKFMANIAILSIVMTGAILLVSGYGLRMIGVPPSTEEVIRLFLYLVICVFYGAFWIGLAMLFSVIFRSMAASLLLPIALWIFFSFGLLVIALAVTENIALLLLQISPNWIFTQTSAVLLQPQLGAGIELAVTGVVQPEPLSLGQSLLHVWQELTILVSLTLICFAISYVVFMRQEVRST